MTPPPRLDHKYQTRVEVFGSEWPINYYTAVPITTVKCFTVAAIDLKYVFFLLLP